MSGSTTPGSPPPEVPEEFAAAYRAAYERAIAAQADGAQHRGEPPSVPSGPAEDSPGAADDGSRNDTEPLARRRGRLRVGTHRTSDPDPPEYDESPTWFERVRDSGWFVPTLLALLAVLLILGAYTVGRGFAGQVDGAQQPVTTQKPDAGAWSGKVTSVPDLTAKADCTAKPGVDASGAKVSYDVANLVDGVADTTWRCAGSAIGEKITLDLGQEVPVAEVGLVPGYAKTDEKSKADRYAQNNRITRVRWTIGTRTVVQKLSGAVDDRSLQLLRIPRTTAKRLVLEILAVKKGPRHTTAISEVQVGRAD